jgi:hypothetical protein
VELSGVLGAVGGGVVGGGVVGGVTVLVSTAPVVVSTTPVLVRVVSNPPFAESGLSRLILVSAPAFVVSTFPVAGGPAVVSAGATRPVSGGAWPVLLSSVFREQAANEATATRLSNRRIRESPLGLIGLQPGLRNKR